jgi:hypothetical protein
MEIVRELRDIPPWVAHEYLASLSGSRKVTGGADGPGWQARVERLPDKPLGFLVFTRIRLSLRGDDAAVAAVWEELEPKLYRGGA